MTHFWNSEPWLTYEHAYGDQIGTRAKLLADANWSTRVLDLTQDEATLWRGVRGSYHSIINRFQRDPDFRLEETMSRVLFCGSCWAMQKRLEGGESRPRASWVVQGKWLQSGVGRCLIAGRYKSTAWNLTAFAYLFSFVK